MAIEFRCPNGHRLSCPDDRAGRTGKCPKCGATFRVPEPGTPVEAHSDSGVGQLEMTDGPADEAPAESPDALSEHSPAGEATPPVEPISAIQAADGSAPARAEERIVFLCPNGHKLNCPARMQGRPGKCPHCGATFLVPQYEAEEESEFADDEFGVAATSASSDEIDVDPPAPAAESSENEFNGAGYEADPFPFDFASLTEGGSAEGPALAGLFHKLWEHRRNGAIVELYLKGGEVLAPEWYSPRYSQEAYGMFAFPETDGSFTLTAVHWDAIERIAVRGVPNLPAGMFDET